MKIVGERLFQPQINQYSTLRIESMTFEQLGNSIVQKSSSQNFMYMCITNVA